jgi:hypothetical protein
MRRKKYWSLKPVKKNSQEQLTVVGAFLKLGPAILRKVNNNFIAVCDLPQKEKGTLTTFNYVCIPRMKIPLTKIKQMRS